MLALFHLNEMIFVWISGIFESNPKLIGAARNKAHKLEMRDHKLEIPKLEISVKMFKDIYSPINLAYAHCLEGKNPETTSSKK